MANVIEIGEIKQKIYFVRGRKVILDSDLANLYEVRTSNLNKAVKRNIKRFPNDFMFQLTLEEVESLRFQIGTSNSEDPSRFQFGTLKKGQNIKYLPYAFTQEGVAMLSGVLHSKAAVEVNIGIMRAFVRLRGMMLTNKELYAKLRQLENKYDKQFKQVFEAIYALMKPQDDPQKPKIGFKVDNKKGHTPLHY